MRLPLFFILTALVFSNLGCPSSQTSNTSGKAEGDTNSKTSAVANASSRFVDVAESSGIHYEWKIPGKRPLNILQTIGNGCAFLDFNQDGNLDILLVGSPLALFQGDGKGQFTNITEKAGLSTLKGHFLGCAVGDVDNDGLDDIYISGYQEGRLLHNEFGKQKGTASYFRDITKESGLKPQPWGTSCAFAETVPGSGKLDLYICNYAIFGTNTEPQLCEEHGKMTSCGPRYYKPRQGVFYRNNGKGVFTEYTKESGLLKTTGRGLGVGFADFAEDGRQGFAIANDEAPGDLLRPIIGKEKGKPAFESIAEMSGTAYDRDGNVHGGMGMDWGDYDNDSRLDLFVATFQNESKSLYHNDGEARFADLGIPTNIGTATIPYVAFGCKFLDYDNDGWLDIVIANGHVQDNIQEIYPNSTFRQTSQLLRNRATTPLAFDDVTASTGKDLAKPIVGRGLAIGDYDNDGKIDILIVDSEGTPLLLHNESPNSKNHWLGIQLTGTKSNRNGYGAVLTLTSGDKKWIRHCHSDGSYLSASDSRVHFGLGELTKMDSLQIRWADGSTETHNNLQIDRYISLKQQ